jgi:hypothetical protein
MQPHTDSHGQRGYAGSQPQVGFYCYCHLINTHTTYTQYYALFIASISGEIHLKQTTNSKPIVFFSAQIEIFSTDTELYVGI